MKTNLFKILAVFFALGLFALTSCKKPNPDSQSAEDDARGGAYMADAFALGNDNAGGGGKADLPEGMTVETLLGVTTITFENCDYKGSVRNGIVRIVYTQQENFGPKAFNLIITFDDYTMDGDKIEGSIATTFGGSYQTPEINVVATDMKIIDGDKEISWSSTQTYTIKEGFSTFETQDDDVIEMSGTMSGNNKDGKDFNSVYASLLKKACTKYPVSGTSTITSDANTIVNYGDGACDNKITVTSEGVTVDITLE